MLPQDALSSQPHQAPFLPPRNRAKLPLVDYELGGLALNDGSLGLQVQVWKLEFIGGEFVLSAPAVTATTVLTIAAEVTEVALSFDQNMQPVLAWFTQDDEAFYYWFDPVADDFVTVELPAGTSPPRLALDDHREIATLGGWSDVILAYIRDGALCYRQQRDRFLTERVRTSGLEGAVLDRIGLNRLLRFQFRVLGGPSSGIAIEPQPVLNGNFELGDQDWTWSGSGSGTIDEVGPVYDGTWSARAGFSSNPNGTGKQLTNDARIDVVPGRDYITQFRVQTPSQGWGSNEDAPWARACIQWYDDQEAELSKTTGPLVYGYDLLGQFLPLRASGAPPADAAYCTPRIEFAWGDGAFAVDDCRMWSSVPGVSIASIVEDICGRAGVEDVDAGELVDDSILGYSITRESSARSVLTQLRTVGAFDIVERGFQLRFPVRGGAPVATITEDDLGAYQASGNQSTGQLRVKLQKTMVQDVELPRQIRFQYKAYDRDYGVGEELSPARHGTIGVNDITAETPITLTRARAARTAETNFRESWAGRWLYKGTLDLGWHALEPADPVLIPVDGREQRARVLRIHDEAMLVRRVDLVRDDDGSYVSTAVSNVSTLPPSQIGLLGDTVLGILNLPSLRLTLDDDAGFYLYAQRAGVGMTWPGARIYESLDGEVYTHLLSTANEAITGVIVTQPAAGGDHYTWDHEREIVVDVDNNATLSSRTRAAVLGGANAAAIGASGRWQIVQFRHAELVSTGRYRLRGLLFGRRGTEPYIDTMVADDAFVLVSGPGLLRKTGDPSQIGAEHQYRAVTNGSSFASGTDQGFTSTGLALKPLAGTQARVSRDGSGNITGSWIRRDRLSETLRDGVTVPMSEDSESYEIDVMDGMTVVRTISGLSSPAFAYSAAEQTTDFGSVQDPVTLRIIQLSAQVGRGYIYEVTL